LRTRAVLVVGLIAFFLLAPARPAAAWGEFGHRVTAIIAYHRLTSAAKARIDRLLQANADDLAPPDFVGSSVWADAARYEEAGTAGWHFAAYPLSWRGSFDSCPGPASKVGDMRQAQTGAEDCLIPRLYGFAARLDGHPDDARSLKFLIHLVGDVHQPLHVADNGNFGGNCVQLVAPKGVANTNLHAFWDGPAAQSLGRDPAAAAAALEARITPEQATGWVAELRGPLAAAPNGWASAWAKETFAMAPLAYAPTNLKPGCGTRRVPATYPRQTSDAAGLQLSKAGVRLAFLLNRLFDPGGPR